MNPNNNMNNMNNMNMMNFYNMMAMNGNMGMMGNNMGQMNNMFNNMNMNNMVNSMSNLNNPMSNNMNNSNQNIQMSLSQGGNISNNNNTNNTTNNNTNNNDNDTNTSGQRQPKETIPRSDKVIQDNGNFSPNEIVKNVSFDASSGLRVVIKAGVSTTIKDLILKYVNKIGLGENVIDKEIIFLFNGAKIDTKSTDNIGRFPDFASVTVIDQNNIIGA